MAINKTLYSIKCNVCGQVKAAYNARAKTCLDCLDAGYKYCAACNTVKQLDDFGTNNNASDGKQTYCRKCQSIRSEVSRKRQHGDDPQYWIDRNEQSKRYNKERYENDNEFKERRRAQNRANCEYNYYNNPEHYNRVKLNSFKRRNSVGNYTTDEWNDCVEAYSYSCAYCGSKHNLTVDHIVALVSGGNNFAYNLVPACEHCNKSKGAKDVVEWYTAQDFYDESRLRNIHKRYRLLQDKLLKELKERREAEGGGPECPK